MNLILACLLVTIALVIVFDLITCEVKPSWVTMLILGLIIVVNFISGLRLGGVI